MFCSSDPWPGKPWLLHVASTSHSTKTSNGRPGTDTPDFVQPYLGESADGFAMVSPWFLFIFFIFLSWFHRGFTVSAPSTPKAHRSEGVRDESSGGRRKDNAAFQALSRKKSASGAEKYPHPTTTTTGNSMWIAHGEMHWLQSGLVDHETVKVVGKVNVGSEVAVKVGQVGVHRVLFKETWTDKPK